MAGTLMPNAPAPSTRTRVVRMLPAAAPTTAAVVVSQPPKVPQSAFWRARLEDLRLAQASLTKLGDIDKSVVEVGGKVGEIEFPAALSVTTSMSTLDKQTFDRLTDAIVTVAKSMNHPGGDCAKLVTMSPAAFTLVARLTTLASHLMDRHDVSARSTLEKFDLDAELIGEARAMLEASGLDDVLPPFQGAFYRPPFDELAKKDETNRSPEVFAELQERAALLLALKCLVATGLDGNSAEWPPQPPVPPPSSDAGSPRRGQG
jgi:hypothetical protein